MQEQQIPPNHMPKSELQTSIKSLIPWASVFSSHEERPAVSNIWHKSIGASWIFRETAPAEGEVTRLEENLAAVLGLKPECRELSVSLLIARFALAILFLLELENFLEWRLGHSSGNLIFTVEIHFS